MASPLHPLHPRTASRRDRSLLANRVRAAACFLAGSSLVSGPVARAANTAWSATPGTPLFSNPNWTANATTPGLPGANVASGDSLYFGTSTQTNLSNDNPGFTYAGLTFNAGGSAFTLGGNGFTLGGDLTNNAATVQTLNTPLVLNASRTATVVAGGGSLVLGGGISGAFNLTATTAFSTSGGPNALALNPVVLGGVNAFSGNLVLSNGTVRLGNPGALNGSTGVTVANNTPNALVFGTDAPLTNSALPVSFYGLTGLTTNSLVLDRATAGPGVTQTIGSLAPQANSLLRVVGGPNATSPGTLVVTGATTLSARLATGTNNATLYASGVNVVLGAVNTLAVVGGTALTSSTLLLDGDSTGNRITGAVSVPGGLTKAGPGTWTLSGTSTVTSAIVNAGTLRLDFSAAGAPASNILAPNAGVSLGGGTVEVVGSTVAASSQSFTSGTQLTQGGSRLVVTAPSGAPVSTVNLGPISRGAGGTLDVITPAGGSVTTSSFNGPNGLLNTTTTNQFTDGVGAVTLNGVGFAMNSTNAPGGSLVPFTAFTALPTTSGLTSGNGSVRSLSASQAQTGSTGFSALRIADTGAGQSLDLKGFALTVPNGTTILQAGGTAGSYTIDSSVTGSGIASTNGTGEIVFNTAAGQTLTVSSANGNLRQAPDSTAFTKTGDGTLVIGNRNFFQSNISSGANGTIRVTGGTLATASLPTGLATIYLNGGTLRYTDSFQGNFNSNVTLSVGGNGATLDAAGAGGSIVNFQGVLAYENVAASARVTLTGGSTAGNVFSPANGIANPRTTASGGSGGTSLVKTGTGSWTVGFGNNPYTGGTTILGGTLVAAGGGYNAGSPFTSTTGLGTGSVVVGDGAGQNATLTSSGAGSAIVLAGANNLTVNAGSALQPGQLSLVGNQTESAPAFGAATLNLAPGAFYDVGITGLFAFDSLRLIGDAALNGATLRLTLGPNVIPTGRQFVILDNDGTADAIAGLLTNGFSIVAGNNTGNYLFSINYAGNDGNDLVLNGVGIVPEPGTWTLLVLGGAALAGVSRRRGR